MTDLEQARHEYITTNTTYQALSDKYGISMSQIYSHSKKEKWREKRKNYEEKTDSKIATAVSTTTAKRRAAIMNGADALYDKWESCLQNCKDGDIKTLRQLVAALRDIRDLSFIKSKEDEKEQKARIKAILRNLELTDPGKTEEIRIIIEGGDEFAE